MSIATLPLVAADLCSDGPWFAAHNVQTVNPTDRDVVWLTVPELPSDAFRWALDNEVMREHATLDLAAVTELLFCSTLDPDDHPSPDEIRDALVRQLDACHCRIGLCLLRVATAAGDHPEAAAERMTWCIDLAAIVLNPFGGERS
jgi:hypothetical protein